MLAATVTIAALHRYAPVIVHDARERYPLAPVSAAPVTVPGNDPDPRPAVYGHAVTEPDGTTWLQYWLFYAGQDQDRGIVRTGRHAGDWEMVQYRLDDHNQPDEAVYAQHSRAERCGYGTVEQREGHPVVYPAHGSHASYLRAGTRDRMWPDPNDEANGKGVVTRPRVVVITRTSPRWMTYPGHWGHAKARWFIPGEATSPNGPAFQPERFDDPAQWARDARACQAGCDAVDKCDDTEMWSGRGAIATAAAGIAAVIWRRRRRTLVAPERQE